jgi:hypothetical protein
VLSEVFGNSRVMEVARYALPSSLHAVVEHLVPHSSKPTEEDKVPAVAPASPESPLSPLLAKLLPSLFDGEKDTASRDGTDKPSSAVIAALEEVMRVSSTAVTCVAAGDKAAAPMWDKPVSLTPAATGHVTSILVTFVERDCSVPTGKSSATPQLVFSCESGAGVVEATRGTAARPWIPLWLPGSHATVAVARSDGRLAGEIEYNCIVLSAYFTCLPRSYFLCFEELSW